MLRRLFRRVKNSLLGVVAGHYNGHFYSAVVDPKDLVGKKQQLWPKDPHISGVDFNEAYHLKVLKEYFPKYIDEYKFVEKYSQTKSDTEYYIQNSQYSWLDSRLLFVLLNQWQPKRIIEVGSGFSSLLTAHVNAQCLNNKMNFKCIEPFPRKFLRKDIPGLKQVIVEKVEDLPLTTFQELDAGDVLFVDSSHVAKTGSDVNYLLFEVLPILSKGVKIHFHDIFLPHEYPQDWVLEENRSWNEQYLLRALLMHSNTFKVLFGSSYAHHKYPELVTTALNLPDGTGFSGSSIWLEKTR